jgi:type I restriction enzyme S subunit
VRILDTFTALIEALTAELAARKKQYAYYRDKLLTFPEGVEYVKISDVAEVGTGSSDRINAEDTGIYPFYVRSQSILRSSRYLFDEEAIIIPGEGGIGDIFHFVTGKYDLHQRAYRVHFMNNRVLTKFAYYFFVSYFKAFITMKAVSATVTSIRKPMIENFSIPLPPLVEQQRIVAILDRFDTLVNDLTNGLPAEIEARRKQYAYYRDKLLTFQEARV